MKIKTNANDRIKAAMRENEQYIIGVIREDGLLPLFGYGIRPVAMWNALDRLEARGRIRLTRREGRKVYVLVTRKAA